MEAHREDGIDRRPGEENVSGSVDKCSHRAAESVSSGVAKREKPESACRSGARGRVQVLAKDVSRIRNRKTIILSVRDGQSRREGSLRHHSCLSRRAVPSRGGGHLEREVGFAVDRDVIQKRGFLRTGHLRECARRDRNPAADLYGRARRNERDRPGNAAARLRIARRLGRTEEAELVPMASRVVATGCAAYLGRIERKIDDSP